MLMQSASIERGWCNQGVVDCACKYLSSAWSLNTCTHCKMRFARKFWHIKWQLSFGSLKGKQNLLFILIKGRDVPILTWVFFTLNWLTLIPKTHFAQFDLRLLLICSPKAEIGMWHWGWGCYENTLYKKIKIGLPEIDTFSVITFKIWWIWSWNLYIKGPYANHILIPQGSTGSSIFFGIKWKFIFFLLQIQNFSFKFFVVLEI